MENIFEKADSVRSVEDICLQIEAVILDGRLKPGDKLPSERELQTQFGRGRGLIREALRMLKQKDLIEIRKGAKGGAYIKNVGLSNISDSLSLFLKQKDIEPDKIIEFRESLDRTITTLAISKGSREQKSDLYKEALAFYEKIKNGMADKNIIGETDRRLNITLAKMAANPLFLWVVEAIQQGFSSYDYALYEEEKFRIATAKNWHDTAREIMNEDPVKAHLYISNHYCLLMECLD